MKCLGPRPVWLGRLRSTRSGDCAPPSRLRAPVLSLLLVLLLPLGSGSSAAAQSEDFATFETGQVRPLALSPDGRRLYALNTPDARLEVFAVSPRGLRPLGSIRVGLEPIAVAAPSDDEVWVVNHLSDSLSIIEMAPGPLLRRAREGLAPGRVVATVPLCDEPRDIVFAGVDRRRAFITSARRGPHCPVPALPTTPGIGRALVTVLDAEEPTGPPVEVLELFSDTPRALAVDASGETVYAAAFHSGNQTTVISKLEVCGGAEAGPCEVAGVPRPGGTPPPNAGIDGIPQRPTGIIVRYEPESEQWLDELGRDWSESIGFDLPDLDLFRIDATADPPVQTAAYASVGTILFNLAVHPRTGAVFVSNTEARNEVRFEGHRESGTTVRGHQHEVRITVVDEEGVRPRHLNKHIDYDRVPVPEGVKERSLSGPLGMVLSADGGTLYLAAFGSSAIGVFDTGALVDDSFEPSSGRRIPVSGGGPSGLVLDPRGPRLFVLTRFDNAVKVIDLRRARETAAHFLHNPEPEHVVAGRPFLYDARTTSSNGEASCGSCHVFGDFDSLAWDLGNPDLPVLPNPNPESPEDFHPLKGPLTTQSLRGLEKQGPMHWRGDRTGAADPESGDFLDTLAAFRAFNGAFGSLLGRDEGEIPRADMQTFAEFALEVRYPPNPYRALDNSLTAQQQRGKTIVNETGFLFGSGNTCGGCHVIDPVVGFFGATGTPSNVPHFRNLYQRIGMFETSGGQIPGHRGPQVRGFGFGSEGTGDTLFGLLSFPTFVIPDGVAGRRAAEQYLLAVESNYAPILGQQATLTARNAATAGSSVDLLIERSEAPLPTLEQPQATECELVVEGTLDGEPRSWLRGTDGLFYPDSVHEPPVDEATLRAQASRPGQERTWTCVPYGSGARMALDRDRDGYYDTDERRSGLDPAATDRIEAGGAAPSDCRLGFRVSNPGNEPLASGRVLASLQRCRDGDPSCDADGTIDGVCRFAVSICLNVPGDRERCVSEDVDRLLLRARGTADARADTARLLEALGALGAGGAGAGGVSYDPPLAGPEQCTAPTAIDVPAGSLPAGPAGEASARRDPAWIRTTAGGSAGPWDRDRLGLRCEPAEGS